MPQIAFLSSHSHLRQSPQDQIWLLTPTPQLLLSPLAQNRLLSLPSHGPPLRQLPVALDETVSSGGAEGTQTYGALLCPVVDPLAPPQTKQFPLLPVRRRQARRLMEWTEETVSHSSLPIHHSTQTDVSHLQEREGKGPGQRGPVQGFL
mmetsp:Transcript_27390/g.53769  ORF Transcript_27390/g.53769 Transcript_27390/m.53769 type:complete len:149 (-) Transcript_27390:1304-1750(-)